MQVSSIVMDIRKTLPKLVTVPQDTASVGGVGSGSNAIDTVVNTADAITSAAGLTNDVLGKALPSVGAIAGGVGRAAPWVQAANLVVDGAGAIADPTGTQRTMEKLAEQPVANRALFGLLNPATTLVGVGQALAGAATEKGMNPAAMMGAAGVSPMMGLSQRDYKAARDLADKPPQNTGVSNTVMQGLRGEIPFGKLPDTADRVSRKR